MSATTIDVKSGPIAHSRIMSKALANALLFTLTLCVIPAIQARTQAEPQTGAKAQTEAKARTTSVQDITSLIDDGKYREAKTEIDAMLAREPESAPTLFQLARYYMSTGSVSNETIVGFSYTREAVTFTESVLGKALTIDPDYADAHALAGLLYAAQNRLEESQASFAEAEKAYVSPAWLDFNKAVLAINRAEYADAAELLKQYTTIHPSKKDKVAGKIYQSAWRLLRRLAVKHPELDPVPAVRKGLIRRVLVEDYIDYLDRHKDNDKPLFVNFASSDNWCSPCLKNMKAVEAIARNHPDKFDFVHVSFEPWRSVSQYASALPKPLRALPHQSLISHGVEQTSHYGTMTERSIRPLVTDNYDDLKAGRLAAKLARKGGPKALQQIEASFEKYLTSKHHYRAMAIALEGSRWTGGTANKRLSQTSANRAALESCERNRTRSSRNVQAACQLYAVDSTRVFGKDNKDILAATEAAQKQDSPVDSALAKYHSKSKPKAFAFARNKAGNWVSYYSYNARSLAGASASALRKCEAKRTRRRFDDACQIYWRNDEQVKPFPLD